MTRWPLILGAGAAAALLATLILSPAAPRVTYHSLSAHGRGDDWVPFRLTDSSVIIGATDGPGVGPGRPVSLAPATAICDASACKPEVAATAAPVDDEREVLALEPRGRWLVTTSLSPTYLPNSLRLRTLAVAVADRRLEAINTAGAIAAGGRSLLSGPGPEARSASGEGANLPLSLPLVLDLGWLKAASDWRAAPGAPGWEVKARFLDDPAKAGFIARADIGKVHGAAVTSTCRRLEVELRVQGQADLAYTVTVADPDWLTPTPLPVKGAIVFQPLCGADAQAQPTITVGDDAIAQAFFRQIGALRAAGHTDK